MIRTQTLSDFRTLDNRIAYAQNFPKHVLKAAQVAFAKPSGEPALIAALSYAPPPVVEWGQGWSNDPVKNANARKAYMRLVNLGIIQTDGEHYIRTHQLSQGYKADLFMVDTEILMSITNPANKAHLYSKGRRQIPGHADRWRKDAPVVTQWLAEWRPALVVALHDEVVQ